MKKISTIQYKKVQTLTKTLYHIVINVFNDTDSKTCRATSVVSAVLKQRDHRVNSGPQETLSCMFSNCCCPTHC